MSFEPVYSTQSCVVEKKICVVQSATQTRIHAPVPLKCVLMNDSQITKAEVERSGGEIRVYGEIVLKILYLDEIDEVGCLQYTTDFSVRERCNEIDAPSFVRSSVMQSEFSVSGREINVDISINNEIFAIREENIQFLTPQSSGIFIKDAHQPFVSVRACNSKTVSANTQCAIDMDEICFTSAKTVFTSLSSSVDCISLGGQFAVHIVGKKQGKIRTEEVVIEFSEEVGVSGALPSDIVMAYARAVRINATTSSSDESVVCTIEVDVDIDYTVSCDGEFTFVCDAYCAQNELLCTTQSYGVCSKSAVYSLQDGVDFSQELENQCDEISCCLLSPIVANVSVNNDEVVFDGVMLGNIVYESGENLNSTSLNQPFSLNAKLPVNKGDEVRILGCKTTAKAKVKRGNLVEIETDVFFDLEVVKMEEIAVITDAQLGEEKESSTSAFSVYFVSSGESLWDVARTLGVSKEELCAQNECEAPLVGGEKIIFYRGGKTE